jgi:hypothetical protein
VYLWAWACQVHFAEEWNELHHLQVRSHLELHVCAVQRVKDLCVLSTLRSMRVCARCSLQRSICITCR